jgi:DNA-binding SARP family transcriptional activator
MVRLHLLGDLRMEVDGSDAVLTSLSRKARLLLAILAVERRVHGRSELAGRLWPDVREDSARVSLRTALSQVRAALGPAASRVLRGERDGGVVLAADVATDLEDIDRLLQNRDAEVALGRCSAELLPGLDEDWVFERRDELRDRLARGLGDAADRAESDGRLEDAIRISRRLVALDPLSETFGREFIRRLADAGDRGAAITAFERLRTSRRGPARRAFSRYAGAPGQDPRRAGRRAGTAAASADGRAPRRARPVRRSRRGAGGADGGVAPSLWRRAPRGGGRRRAGHRQDAAHNRAVRDDGRAGRARGRRRLS